MSAQSRTFLILIFSARDIMGSKFCVVFLLFLFSFFLLLVLFMYLFCVVGIAKPCLGCDDGLGSDLGGGYACTIDDNQHKQHLLVVWH